jgi:GT2 family glycosyltransferase
MSEGHPLVSVIVVNWNRREILRHCLHSLARQTLGNYEVIVVDNGSSDGSLELGSDGTLPPAQWIANTGNQGFGVAVNQGITASQGDFIALLNNDAEAAPGWLATLVDALHAHPRVGMAASKIVAFDDHGTLDKVGHLIYPDGQNRGRGSGEKDEGQFDAIEEVAWPDGCAALYRREMIDSIGGFDEDFFAYADDAELGLRGQLAGWTCLYVPRAVVYHRLGSTLGRFSEQRLFLIERNRIWLVAKLFPWRLIVVNPFYFTLRCLATAYAALTGRGEAAMAQGQLGLWRLMRCILKAQVAGWAGVPTMLRKRRGMRAARKLSSSEGYRLIRRFQIPLCDLVFKAR